MCVTERDTIVVTEPDSALFWAWVRCDSLGNALIEQMAAEAGRRTSLSPRAVAQGGRTLISVKADTRPDNVIVRRKEIGRMETRASSASDTKDTRTAGGGLLHRLGGGLRLVIAFLAGLAAGYILKTLRP